MGITHHGPAIALFSVQLQHIFSYVGGVLVTNRFSRLLIDRYIVAIQQIMTHKEHLRYSFWFIAVFWTASEALALWPQQRKLIKTTWKSLSLSNSSQKSPFFSVLMYALYGHPSYSKFKQKHQQYGPCFQTIFPFLMTIGKERRDLNQKKLLKHFCSKHHTGSHDDNAIQIIDNCDLNYHKKCKYFWS